jgi:hypothetical protein
VNDFDQLSQLATRYFDGLYEGSIETLDAIFHDRSRLHVILEGKLVEIEFAAYRDIVRGRESPQSLGSRREDNIVAIIQSTPTTAIIIVKLLLVDKSYVDHLALIKDEGRWQILSKTYHLNASR